MEFVAYSLRQVIDKPEMPFTPAQQMRVILGLAKCVLTFAVPHGLMLL